MSNLAFTFDHVHIIAPHPDATADSCVEMFGAKIANNSMASGALQIFSDLGGV